MKKTVKDVGPGITSIELLKDPHNPNRTVDLPLLSTTTMRMC
ncbi:unnamed protein product [Rhodiola kirilowii]